MRLRRVTLTLLTVAALGAAPFALADPLDPDPSFGGDGVIKLDGSQNVSWFGEQQLATHNGLTFVAGGAMGAGSGESSLYIQARGKKGHFIRSNGGHLEMTSPYPQVRDVLTARRRVFLVGWLKGGYDWKRDVQIPPYGFAAAFRRGLRGHSHWGTDRYFTYDAGKNGAPGLERLREVDFGSVTGGAIDAQGRLLVAGRLHGQAAVLRLTRDGHIDHSYGTNGLATVTIGSGSSPHDLAVHGTAALVVGTTTIHGRTHGFATQITGYGYRDRTFSGDGIRLIGKPRTQVTTVSTAEAGRWLVGSERRRHATVTKLGATGTLVTTFGRGGHTTVRCSHPEGQNVIDALTTDRKNGDLHRITLALSCRRGGDVRRLAAIWRPGGEPITSLAPDGVARLPWNGVTVDLTYSWRGRLLGLIPDRLIRLR